MIDSLKSTDDIKNLRDSLKSEIGNNVTIYHGVTLGGISPS